MDSNQRSEFNNQTNNGANEKWTPGSQGASADNGQPLDHTYPQGLGVQQQGNQTRDLMGTQQSGAGPGAAPGGMGGRANDNDAGIPGGSMETQINGGSGTVQGITDSHQRQMEQKSGAYGMLEQPVGHRHLDSGTELPHLRDMGRDDVRGQMGSQNSAQPDLRGGSMSNSQGNLQRPNEGRGGATGALGGNAHVTTGNQQAAAQGAGELGGQEAQRGNTQGEVAGSRATSNQNSDAGGVHESNDVAGGLPRSPGNSGADSTSRTGSQTGADGADSGPAVHDSNDAAGGYPRSPGYANKLNGDSNMDEDTGFKRK
jgi:hypothetical protein